MTVSALFSEIAPPKEIPIAAEMDKYTTNTQMLQNIL